MPRALIAVPALNEAASIRLVIRQLREHQPDADILVIDDGSEDGTGHVAAQEGVPVCRLPFNLGVGGAMRTAYRFALRAGYDIVVQVDADGQHDPRFVGELIRELAVSDVVVGARFAGEGNFTVTRPRRLAMRLLAGVLSKVCGTKLTDVTSGFRAVNHRGIRLFASHYPSEYLGDTVESLVIAVRAGCTISQVPVEMRERTAGNASQSDSRAVLYLFRAVAALFLALARSWQLPDVEAPRSELAGTA